MRDGFSPVEPRLAASMLASFFSLPERERPTHAQGGLNTTPASVRETFGRLAVLAQRRRPARNPAESASDPNWPVSAKRYPGARLTSPSMEAINEHVPA